jgi:hypothetical protein
VFVCRADTARIVVDRLADETLRYRSWTRPRALTDKPDLEITGGKAEHSALVVLLIYGQCVCSTWVTDNVVCVFVSCLSSSVPESL